MVEVEMDYEFIGVLMRAIVDTWGLETYARTMLEYYQALPDPQLATWISLAQKLQECDVEVAKSIELAMAGDYKGMEDAIRANVPMTPTVQATVDLLKRYTALIDGSDAPKATHKEFDRELERLKQQLSRLSA